MYDVTGRLARASSLHPGRALAAWGAALLLSLAAIVGLLGSALTTDAEMTNDPESYRGYDLIAEHFPPTGDYVNELVVVRSSTLTVDDAAFRAKVEALRSAIEETGVTQPVRTYYSTQDATLVSPSRRATVIPVGLNGDGDAGIGHVIEVVDAAAGDGFETAITGEFTADRDFSTLSQEDLRTGELQFGLPAALVILLLVFGAVVAGLVPVLVALVAIVVALGLTALVGQAFDLSVFVVNMISGMGLALGIDYSLFVVSRFREERRHGHEKLDAIATVGSTASRAVLFSGSAFVLAMVGMVLVPDTILRSLATGAILVGMVTVVAALTLLPAVLSLLGRPCQCPSRAVAGTARGGERGGGGPRLVAGRPRGHTAPARRGRSLRRSARPGGAAHLRHRDRAHGRPRAPRPVPREARLHDAARGVRRRHGRLRPGRRRGRRRVDPGEARDRRARASRGRGSRLPAARRVDEPRRDERRKSRRSSSETAGTSARSRRCSGCAATSCPRCSTVSTPGCSSPGRRPR